jgi:hypothetical protein
MLKDSTHDERIFGLLRELDCIPGLPETRRQYVRDDGTEC